MLLFLVDLGSTKLQNDLMQFTNSQYVHCMSIYTDCKAIIVFIGKCNKGERCPFIHDPSKIAVCTKYVN